MLNSASISLSAYKLLKRITTYVARNHVLIRPMGCKGDIIFAELLKSDDNKQMK